MSKKKALKDKPSGMVKVVFTKPSFRIGGIEYKSADVEEAAAGGSEVATELIERLVKMGAGCVKVIED